MSRYFFCFILLFVLVFPCRAQFNGPPNTPEEYAEQYRWRISQESLNGVYIPPNLEAALKELDRLTEEDSRRAFAALPEAEAYRRLYHSLRLWIINKWGLNGGSRLSYLFHSLQLTHPDDLAELIIVSWHRQLNGRSIDMPEKIAELLEIRKEIWAAAKERSRQ